MLLDFPVPMAEQKALCGRAHREAPGSGEGEPVTPKQIAAEGSAVKYQGGGLPPGERLGPPCLHPFPALCSLQPPASGWVSSLQA